jgi:hypothetical protein
MVRDHFSTVAAKCAECRPGDPPSVATRLGDLAPSRQLAWDSGMGSGQAAGILTGPLADVAAVLEPLLRRSTRLVVWPIHLMVRKP